MSTHPPARVAGARPRAAAYAGRSAQQPGPDPAALDRALAGEPGAPEHFRDSLREARRALGERLFAGVSAQMLVRQEADLVDEVVVRVFEHLRGRTEEPVALVAVGGYGRRELHPGSDVDLLLLFEDPPSAAGNRLVQRFLAFLWDAGLEVGHSTRTLPECVEQAARDVTVITNLMEARLLAGDRPLFEAMREATAPPAMWPSRDFFEAKLAEQVQRHHKLDDAVYNLEPNVKEGPGGLRDLQTITWVLKRHFGAETLHELLTHEFLTPGEYASLMEGQNFLWQIRFGLHVLAGRKEERLLFDYQRSLAARFGYTDDGRHLGVEKLMKRYYRVIMELRRLNEMLLELFQELLLYGDHAVQITPINERFQAVNGFLEVTSEAVFRNTPCALMEMFLLLEQRAELQGVRASTIRLVRDHRWLIDEGFRHDPQVRRLFITILRQPAGITHELRRMHRYGVLAAYLPVFEAVVGQMQYDLFHVYTVDEHTLFVVRNVRAFAVPQKRHEFPLCSSIFDRLAKPELLYIAALFHDIGKGRGGDHSELGAGLALAFCHDHGLSPYDARVVAWLVRHHLLMSVTAQRRDITDPEVVNEFARTVTDHAHLDYLYLLTVADIRGTNPTLWNDWKDTLLKDLYHATSRALRRGLENPVDRAELIAETRAAALELLGGDAGPRTAQLWDSLGDDYFLRATPDEIAWHTRAILTAAEHELPLVLMRDGRGGSEVFVYARDQKFLFAATTTVLGRCGLTILDARIITADNGMTLDSYVVLDTDGGGIDDPVREGEITGALREQLTHPADTPRQVNRRERRQLRHFAIPTRVTSEVDPVNRRTMVEVTARDRPGLLARIGWAMADSGARLQNARIATFGERAEDVFYITDPGNRPLQAERLEALARTVREYVDTP